MAGCCAAAAGPGGWPRAADCREQPSLGQRAPKTIPSPLKNALSSPSRLTQLGRTPTPSKLRAGHGLPPNLSPLEVPSGRAAPKTPQPARGRGGLCPLLHAALPTLPQQPLRAAHVSPQLRSHLGQPCHLPSPACPQFFPSSGAVGVPHGTWGTPVGRGVPRGLPCTQHRAPQRLSPADCGHA